MGIFDNIESIFINNKEVQSIVLTDGGGVLYEKQASESLVMSLTVIGSSFETSPTPFVYTGEIFVDWGDNTELTEYTGGKLTHNFTDGLTTHSVKIYGDITSLGNYCFNRCTNLISIDLLSGITSLGAGCFGNCTGLTFINLPLSVTSIGESCFANCESLTFINLPLSVTSIGESCFANCTSLASINLPLGITSLGNYCFVDCTGLTSINLPSGLTSLGEGCFVDCTGLTSIDLPSGITNLGDYCFQSCTGLTSINLPSGITSLGDYCFDGCTDLTSINLPLSITSLGDYCFGRCADLTSIHLEWIGTNILTYNSNWIRDANTNLKFEIPEGTTQLYIDKGYPAAKLEEEEVIELTLETDKSILSFCDSDSCSLTATLSGRNAGNKTIEFFNGETFLGDMVTDNNGVASITYISQGVGDIEVYAKYGTLTSEILSIEDCIKTFKLDGTDNYRTFRGSSKSFNEGVMTAKSCVAYGFENSNSFRLEFEWLGGYAIIMPSNETSIDRNWIQIWTTGGYVYINGSRSNLPAFSEPFVQTTDGFYKVILEKDNGTYRFKVEDTVICEFTNVPSATEWAVGIDHYLTASQKIKNIKVKPL